MLLPLLLNNLLETGDSTAPVLSAPTATATGPETATGTVTTDEGNGTLYYWFTENSSETAANIKASGESQSVTATGVQNVSVSGLTADTTYYAHYVQDDAASNESNVVSSTAITTEEPSETVETSFPTDRVGGGKAGWNQRKREKQRRDEEEFLEIIKIAMPEIMKYLK